MIVQTRGGDLLLIRQTDHAALAGQFAEHWGNAAFAAPDPRGPLTVAARHHDDGWLRWEAAPRVDPRTRRPYQFTDLPVAEHLDFYQSGIERVLSLDGYAGLLTSLHLSGLYQRRFGTDPQMPLEAPPPEEERVLRKILAALQLRQTTLRRELPARGVPAAWLEEPRLWCNYKLLQDFDRLSLYFCMRPPHPAALGPAPTDGQGGEVQLTLQPRDATRVVVTPYPFDESPLPLAVRASVVPDRPYESDEDFRAAFAAAPVTELHFEVLAEGARIGS